MFKYQLPSGFKIANHVTYLTKTKKHSHYLLLVVPRLKNKTNVDKQTICEEI